MRKTLIVGGTGALGGHAAVYLADHGHEVTVAARKPPAAGTPMAKMPFLAGDYVAGDFTAEALGGFDWVLFAAGNDPRHLVPDTDPADHFAAANIKAIPEFFAICRDAGVQRAVQLGSFYPQAAPLLEAGNSYIASRRAACEGARAHTNSDFAAISVNAPFMVGTVPGLPSMIFEPYVRWAQGKLALPPKAPTGGTNFMSFRSLSEAILGAFERGEPGKAYLVGDEDLSFAQYFQLFFDAVGNNIVIEAVDEPCPLLPDVAIPQGRGNWVHVDPDPAELALLGYRRGDVATAVRGIVEQFG